MTETTAYCVEDWNRELEDNPHRDTAARFHTKYAVGDDGCWRWMAALNNQGYGRFRLDGKSRQAHRVSYELFVGPIPEGLEIDHLCRVRRCVNPAHLEPVTSAENKRRSPAHGVASGQLSRERAAARTHCPHGHVYDESNTYLGGSGRMCRTCNREAVRRHRQRKKAAA